MKNYNHNKLLNNFKIKFQKKNNNYNKLINNFKINFQKKIMI